MPAELPLLWVQGALIEQALVNVLDNAARFSPPAGVIDICLSHDGESFFFTISDQGPGIPADEQSQVFDLFYTAARGDRGGQGTGLGLAICLGMLNAHGGTARVESAPGQGTRVILQLPLQHPDASAGHD